MQGWLLISTMVPIVGLAVGAFVYGTAQSYRARQRELESLVGSLLEIDGAERVDDVTAGVCWSTEDGFELEVEPSLRVTRGAGQANTRTSSGMAGAEVWVLTMRELALGVRTDLCLCRTFMGWVDKEPPYRGTGTEQAVVDAVLRLPEVTNALRRLLAQGDVWHVAVTAAGELVVEADLHTLSPLEAKAWCNRVLALGRALDEAAEIDVDAPLRALPEGPGVGGASGSPIGIPAGGR